MKHLTTCAVFILALLSISFQNNAQEIKLKGGLNTSNTTYYWKDEDRSDEFSAKLGFQFGATVEFAITDHYSFNTGVMMVQRLHKSVNEYEQGDEWHLNLNKWYLEVPVLFRREFKFNKMAVFGEFGPYAGAGLAISSDIEHYVNGELLSEGSFYAEWGSGDNDTKRFDAGLNFGVGVAIDKLEVVFAYEHGLINTENVDYREKKNRAFFVNLSYPVFAF